MHGTVASQAFSSAPSVIGLHCAASHKAIPVSEIAVATMQYAGKQ
jgi:hypothetical protein